ncbi:chaplin [Streptomyces sp. NPDC028635]|uniref:chaplin n=1 Tax=Streptomyces sp. NPDC028635 TaxID=3154800 RepID=UPI0033F1D0BE
MKRVTRKGLIAVAAASGAMALTGAAYADSAADGTAAGSPGLISGNTVQLPVHVPVNVCGNTVSVAGVLNPAAGNRCANTSDGGSSAPGAGGSGHARSGGTAPGATRSGASGGARADGVTSDSPGVLSGNGIQLPVDLPVNVTGNSVNVVGIGNPATGNTSVNHSGGHPAPGPARPTPRPAAPPKRHPAPHVPQQQAVGSLAHTGAEGDLPAAIGSAALVLGGAALYRRFRPQTGR